MGTRGGGTLLYTTKRAGISVYRYIFNVHAYGQAPVYVHVALAGCISLPVISAMISVYMPKPVWV